MHGTGRRVVHFDKTQEEEGGEMSFLEPIIRELSQKFSLGTHAGALAMEALRTVTNERGGGLTGFISRFEQHFDHAPMSERKSMVRQLVDRIVIDRTRRVAMCYLLKIPKGAGKIVENLLEKERTHITSVPPTRFELVFQA